MDENLPEESQQATLRSVDDQRLQGLVESYVEAWENADVEALLGLLTDDAVIAMPPRPTWYRGREATRAFLAEWPLSAAKYRWRLVPARANGQLAFASYDWNEETGSYVPHGIHVLTLARSGQISELTAFLYPEALGRLGAPSEIRA